jgi:hypothetical protein
MNVNPTLALVVVLVALLASALSPRPARARQGGPGAGQGAPTAGAPYYALVIGNDDYAHLPKLTTAAADARSVADVLRESYGFRTELLVNASRSQIVAALSAYGRESGADASLLVYYAGHGYRDGKADRAYWLPVDASPEDATNRIAADEVTAGIRLVRARHVLVASDSCYSGTLTGGLGVSPAHPSERAQFLQRMAAGRSRTLMAAGGDAPAADVGDGGHSVFAAALLRGLSRMDGPRFTAFELFAAHVVAPVAARTGRTPVYRPLPDSGHEGGDFVFTRIKPAPAPGSCDDLETKASLYRTFIDDFRGTPERQKVAYAAGKDYIARYESCTKESDRNVVAYIRKWVAKYEAAVREFERWKSRRP